MGTLEGDPQAADWCGHVWSPWTTAAAAVAAIPAGANGLYRIRRAGDVLGSGQGAGRGLLYIGQGLVGARLATHAQKAHIAGHPQAGVFAGALECSYVLDGAWHTHQRLELENDLIAAYVLSTGAVPPGKFIG